MAKKEKWEIERDKENKLKADAMKSLTKDQLDAINLAHKAIEDALLNIREIEDLYLSDIKNLEIAVWRLRNLLNLGEK